MEQYNTPLPEDHKSLSWTQRNGFPDWVVALAWVIGAFILFQVFGALFAVLIIAVDPSTGLSPAMIEDMQAYLDHFFIANSLAQVLVFGIGTWMVAGLSVPGGSKMRFLRLQKGRSNLELVLTTALLMLAMQPLIWLLGWLNQQVPMPETLLELEQSQMAMIEQYLTGEHVLLLTVLYVALVPALFEEVLYRGYIMRLLERSWGIIMAILVSGVLFGLYHMRLSQLIPLAVIGILLAYVTWRSNSIYPAIVAHFVNNAGSVVAATMYSDYMIDQMEEPELPPFWLLLLSLLFTTILILVINTKTEPREEEEDYAQPEDHT